MNLLAVKNRLYEIEGLITLLENCDRESGRYYDLYALMASKVHDLAVETNVIVDKVEPDSADNEPVNIPSADPITDEQENPSDTDQPKEYPTYEVPNPSLNICYEEDPIASNEEDTSSNEEIASDEKTEVTLAEEPVQTDSETIETTPIEETAPAESEEDGQTVADIIEQSLIENNISEQAEDTFAEAHEEEQPTQQDIVEEPIAEEPVAEDPIAEEPVAEEPVEEPVVEQPVEEPDEEPGEEERVIVEQTQPVVVEPLSQKFVEPGAGAKKLMSAFTINDKFRFRRELFLNSDIEFKNALDLISVMQSPAEAEDYFYSELGYNPEDPVTKDFMKIITGYLASKS